MPATSSDGFDTRSLDWYIERLGQRNAELREARAEVERLRSALERVESHGAGHAVTIARDALNAS